MKLTPERWQHVARIYELAVDQDPATRDAFLSNACAGDEALRCAVLTLWLVRVWQKLCRMDVRVRCLPP